VFNSFLGGCSDIINHAYRAVEDHAIHYFIILKEDNFENRDRLFSLLEIYEQWGVSHKLPIYIQFLPKNAIGRVTKAEEIQLD
jgi:hypothetical protein